METSVHEIKVLGANSVCKEWQRCEERREEGTSSWGCEVCVRVQRRSRAKAMETKGSGICKERASHASMA